MNALYISYDGALDPLGSSQIIPYLLGLSKEGVNFTLLTFEKRENLLDLVRLDRTKLLLKEHGIKWERLRYHKSPTVPATAFDILAGSLKGLLLVFRGKISIIHARSFVAALPAVLLVKLFGLKFIYDLRGFWPEERVEGGLWKKNGILFKVSKYFEKSFIRNSHQIVVLTKTAKKVLEESYFKGFERPVEIIPTCVDLDLFSSGSKNETSDRLVFSYLGSLGTWYCLDEMIDFFKLVKQKFNKAYFMFFTPSDRGALETRLLAKGLSRQDFGLKKLDYREVPESLKNSTATIFFIKPVFSKKSSCPTKFAESLACGVPVIANAGIGDCDEVISSNRIGVLVDNFSQDSYLKAISELECLLNNKEELGLSCRLAAERLFSLEDGVVAYSRIYERLK